MSDSSFDNGEIKRRSGWLIPLAVFVVTAALSALVLIYYLAPSPLSLLGGPAPIARTDPVAIEVGGLLLRVPENYILYAKARRGGEQKEVALVASLPDWHGFSVADAQAFTANAADSPAVFMLIRNEPLDLTELERLNRIYLSYVTRPSGEPGPFGLMHYVFRDDSGYRNEDLFVGQNEEETVVLRCVRLSGQVPSPSCLRDMQLHDGVALSYRFKRARLSQWREIAQGVGRLIRGFELRARRST